MQYDQAASILGKYFIPPELVAQARGVKYRDMQLRNFQVSLPPEDVLRWCADNSFAVIAGPPEWLSTIAIRELDRKLFLDGRGWYLAGEKFAREHMAALGQWSVFCARPVEGSLNKLWHAQLPLLRRNQRVPNAGECAWAFTTYHAVRKEALMSDVCVRTDSWCENSDRVYMGFDGPDGLNVWHYVDTDKSPNVGLAAVLVQ